MSDSIFTLLLGVNCLCCLVVVRVWETYDSARKTLAHQRKGSKIAELEDWHRRWEDEHPELIDRRMFEPDDGPWPLLVSPPAAGGAKMHARVCPCPTCVRMEATYKRRGIKYQVWETS